MDTPTRQEAVLPVGKTSLALQDCLAILLDEIELAFQWDRPGILFAVHRSKRGLQKAQSKLQSLLAKRGLTVMYFQPVEQQVSIPQALSAGADLNQVVYFVEQLGAERQVYAGLNLYRELIVENRLKTLFWLLESEMNSLARLSPDFWAFRHRVIKLPVRLGAERHFLPAGSLLWGLDEISSDRQNIEADITLKSDRLAAVQSEPGSIVTRVALLYELARLCWAMGRRKASEAYLLWALEQVDRRVMRAELASVLNGLSIQRFEERQYGEAIQLSLEAMRAAPSRSFLLANHGVICLYASRKKQAVVWVQKALAMQPEASALWAVLGMLQIATGDYEGALPAFEKAGQLAPAEPRHQVGVALCYLKLGEVEALKRQLQILSAATQASPAIFEVYRAGLSGKLRSGIQKLCAMLEQNDDSAGLRRDPYLYLIYKPNALAKVFALYPNPED